MARASIPAEIRYRGIANDRGVAAVLLMKLDQVVVNPVFVHAIFEDPTIAMLGDHRAT